MSGKIHPGRLLKTLHVLLSPSGGIKSIAEVDRLVSLMEKFSRKLVSRIIYTKILISSTQDLLELFLSRKGWNLVRQWFEGATKTNNVPLCIKLLELLLRCPQPPNITDFEEMIKCIRILTKRMKQIDMSVRALQVLSKWRISNNVCESSSGETLNSPQDSESSLVPRAEFKGEIQDSTVSSASSLQKKTSKTSTLSVSFQGRRVQDILDGGNLKAGRYTEDVNCNLLSQQSWTSTRKQYPKWITKGKYLIETFPKLSGSASVRNSEHKKSGTCNENSKTKTRRLEKSAVKMSNNVNSSQKPLTKFKLETKISSKECKADSSSNKRINDSMEDKRKVRIEEFKRKRKEETLQSQRNLKEKISFHHSEYKHNLDKQSRSRIKKLATSMKGELNTSNKEDNLANIEESVKLKSKSSDSVLGIRRLSTSSKNSKKSTTKEALKEVNIFQDDNLETSRVKSKLRIKRRSASESESSATVNPVKKRKKVQWKPGEKLSEVKYFDVVENERGNVFKQKFEEKRKQEARREKFKLSEASSKMKIAELYTQLNAQRQEKIGKCWPPLLVLDKCRKDIKYGGRSEERHLQEIREAEVLPFLWAIKPSSGVPTDPLEVDAANPPRRSMVVSVKSIPQEDLSGEGTVSDYSRTVWPRQVLEVKVLGSNSQIKKHPPLEVGGGGTKGSSYCIFWNRGYCRNEHNCRFLHELKPQPSLSTVPATSSADM